MKNFYKKSTFLYLESICLKYGSLQNILYHNKRLNHTLNYSSYDLYDYIRDINQMKGIRKVRFLYDKVNYWYEILPYTIQVPIAIRLVYDDKINYAVKFLNREVFHSLKMKYLKYKEEEMLIVKNGLITDTSYSNVLFFDGDKYYTPSTPLLYGTKRQLLLDKKKIVLRDIKPQDLSKYKSIHLINSMLDINDCKLPIDSIIL